LNGSLVEHGDVNYTLRDNCLKRRGVQIVCENSYSRVDTEIIDEPAAR
jgi:hypothetical protein